MEHIIDKLEFAQGLDIDEERGFELICSKQFPGNPERAFGEQIQNAIDSYPSSLPMAERQVDLATGPDWFAVIDFGEGLPREKIELLLTVGGTDKGGDATKLGRFGIGFFSIFNAKLRVKRLEVSTRCEGHAVVIQFLVEKPGKKPRINFQILPDQFPFSTRVCVYFQKAASSMSQRAVKASKDYLEYFPCLVRVNGETYQSRWHRLVDRGAEGFTHKNCQGLVLPTESHGTQRITILCKWERIMTPDLNHLAVRGCHAQYDLRDFASSGVPYVQPKYDFIINSNELDATIARDRISVDGAFYRMMEAIETVLFHQLDKLLEKGPLDDMIPLIVANHFIFHSRMKGVVDSIRNGAWNAQEEDLVSTRVIRRLVEAKIYPLYEHREKYSLLELVGMRDPNKPVFYSPTQANCNWLGGNFKHDFIILPDVGLVKTIPGLYEQIFSSLFGEAINLDRIELDQQKLADLVERGIVSKEDLEPHVRLLGEKRLSRQQADLLMELERILADARVKEAVQRHLDLGFSRIIPVFFAFEKRGAYIATGLFNSEGRAIDDLHRADYSNVGLVGEFGMTDDYRQSGTVLLGLHLDHPLIQHLCQSSDPYRSYYTILLVAEQLAVCQKKLTPYSRLFYVIKESLATKLREIVVDKILLDKAA